jgi:hypothetical protein
VRSPISPCSRRINQTDSSDVLLESWVGRVDRAVSSAELYPRCSVVHYARVHQPQFWAVHGSPSHSKNQGDLPFEAWTIRWTWMYELCYCTAEHEAILKQSIVGINSSQISASFVCPNMVLNCGNTYISPHSQCGHTDP